MTRLDVVTEGNGHQPPPPAAPPGDAPAGSVLAQLRARAANQQRDRRLDIPLDIDPWHGLLVARYRLPSMEDADRLVSNATALTTTGAPATTTSWARASVDVMATCCVTLLGRADTGELEDLQNRYTGRLLQLLDLPFPAGVENPQDITASEVIGTLFADNWLAVNVHAGQIMSWLQEGSEPLGEANAAT